LGSTPKMAPLQSLFIALYVGPHARRIAVWLIGASADDLERAVVLLDVRVTESHITVGCAVLESHGNCHGSNLRVRRHNAGRDRK
jgi:hypothetical protein